MSFTYRIIAPLIVPRLKKGCDSPNMKSFMFGWNKKTGEQTIEITDPNGTRMANNNVSISEILSEGVGGRLLHYLDATYLGWEHMYGIIDTDNKKITLIFKDNGNNTLGIRTY
jgi:hypothetical protein